MVMSRDPGYKFQAFFNFHLILCYISGKVTKFGGHWLKNKKVTGKNKTRDGTPPQRLSTLSRLGGWNPPPKVFPP